MALDANRYDPDAVLNTQILLKMLRSVPENRDAMNKFPTDQLLKIAGNAQTGQLSVRTETNPASTVADPPLPVDAWGNPIIFVPRGGLKNVLLKATGPGTNNRITSVGIDNTSYSANQIPPVPSGAQPFFASAGPDGAFDRLPGVGDVPVPAGDDNVYSFEN